MPRLRNTNQFGGASRKGAPLFAPESDRAGALRSFVLVVLLSAVAVAVLFMAFGDMGPEKEGLSNSEGAPVVSEAKDSSANAPSGEGWSSAMASAYSLEDNDGWDQTASGIPLDETTPTVAVPLDRSDLLGTEVDISYGGMVVRATVTDVGNFGSEGRLFDLSPALWRGFGFETVDEWGVREVSYRFVS